MKLFLDVHAYLSNALSLFVARKKMDLLALLKSLMAVNIAVVSILDSIPLNRYKQKYEFRSYLNTMSIHS